MGEHWYSVVIDGEGLSPETLDVTDLAKLLPRIRESVRATAGIPADRGSRRQMLMSLVGVEKGSVSLRVLPSGGVMCEGMDRMIEAVALETTRLLGREASQTLYDLSQFIERQFWRVCLRSNTGSGVAEISRDRPIPPPAPVRVREKRTLYGVLCKLQSKPDGKGCTATIELTRGGQQTVSLSEPMLRELGKRILEPIGLEGEARVDPASWKIVEFTATALTPYRGSAVGGVVRALRETAGDAWKGVDAVEYVKQVRSEEDEDDLPRHKRSDLGGAD